MAWSWWQWSATGSPSSPRPDEASLAATQAALPVLLDAVQAGGDLAEASRAAVVAGRASVAGLGEPREREVGDHVHLRGGRP